MASEKKHLVASVKERGAAERAYMEAHGLKTLIVSVSGGVDSSAAAVVCKAAAPQGAAALLLPCSTREELEGERRQDLVDGQRVVDQLGIPAVTIDLSSLWEQATELFTQGARELAEKRGVPLDEQKLNWAINNMKPTLRMMTAGFFSDAFQGLVMGTSNGIEHFLGYFSIRGDGMADRQPLRDCTKGDVRRLAVDGGLAADLVNRVPTGGLWPGQTDEGELGFSYDDADRFFVWLLDRHLESPVMDGAMTLLPEAVEPILSDPTLPVPVEVARKIIAQNRRTAFKRGKDDLQHVLTRRGLL